MRFCVIPNCQRQDNILGIGGTYRVILKCLRHDNTLDIGGTYHVILNLFQDLKKNPPTLTLPLKGGRGNLVGRHYYADRKINSRVSNPDQRVTERIDTTPETNYNSNMINYKSENKNVREVQCNHTPHSTHSTHAKRVAFTLAEGATHVDMSDNIRRVAFTLAEVLITLAIIGIVAAVTIPTLITKYQEKQTVTRFKWIYSTLANAFTMAVAENGAPETWDLNSAEDMANILSKYMRISEKCYNTAGCLPPDLNIVALTGEMRYTLPGNANYVKSRFNNGISLMWFEPHKGCSYSYIDTDGNQIDVENSCGSLYAFISTNRTNRYGLDHFVFTVTPKGILPGGYDYNDSNIKRNCTKNWTSDGNTNGATCGEWIRRWGNADYWYDN